MNFDITAAMACYYSYSPFSFLTQYYSFTSDCYEALTLETPYNNVKQTVQFSTQFQFAVTRYKNINEHIHCF